MPPELTPCEHEMIIDRSKIDPMAVCTRYACPDRHVGPGIILNTRPRILVLFIKLTVLTDLTLE